LNELKPGECLEISIRGQPTSFKSNSKARRKNDPWKKDVMEQTKDCVRIIGSCRLTIEFYLTSDRYDKDHLFGPDLDNLAKSTLDALCETIFCEIDSKQQRDACILDLHLLKVKAESEDHAGALLRIERLQD